MQIPTIVYITIKHAPIILVFGRLAPVTAPRHHYFILKIKNNP